MSQEKLDSDTETHAPASDQQPAGNQPANPTGQPVSPGKDNPPPESPSKES